VSSLSCLKKTGYILLFLLIVLQAGGLLFYYEVEQAIVYHKQHRLLEKHKGLRELLVIDEMQYQQHRKGKDELVIGEKMYDVLSVKKVNSTYYITVVHDKDEENIMQKISFIAGVGQNDHAPVPDVLMKLLSFVYLLPDPYTITMVFPAKKEIYAHHKVNLTHRNLSVVSPPPDFALCLY
jgi:hypothetical protein